jgi:hypothetical protein
MLHAVLLAALVTANAPEPPKTPIQRCFATMDGAVYHGDPSDRVLMRANVAACETGLAQISRMPATSAQGPEKLFLTGRILDRAATLSYMGLDDARTALREVSAANLYFRVASGLPGQSTNYRDAALANITLTSIQLRTLHSDIAAATLGRPAIVALHRKP